MAVKKSNKPAKTETKKPVTEFKSPTETWWGKLIIWFLVIGTLLGIIGGAILGLIEYFS